jgi:hypothetical protein
MGEDAAQHLAQRRSRIVLAFLSAPGDDQVGADEDAAVLAYPANALPISIEVRVPLSLAYDMRLDVRA